MCVCGDHSLEHNVFGRCTKCPCFLYRPESALAKFDRESAAIMALYRMKPITARVQ